jgi:serine/threonine protein kinase/tetratricopeptide (TPR) repeat protein
VAESLLGVIDRLGRYVLLDRLGRGAFGTVWAAYDPQLDRRVAIKIVHARRREGEVDKTREDLLSEAQFLAQLSHPNVVAIHDVGRLEDALGPGGLGLLGAGSEAGEGEGQVMVGVFIVMEFLAGPTLAEWLGGPSVGASASVHASHSFAAGAPEGAASRSGLGASPRGLEEILRVFTEAGRGLLAAHARDLVHLDFKPGNVMFGAEGRVRVLDFGLARVGRRLRRQTVEHTRVAGTPAYMAPEQHEANAADARADQYAFCVALWEALYGRRPFEGEDAESLYLAKREGPPKLASPHPHLHAALERGLSVDPGDRFASMEELLEVLADDPRLRRRRWVAGVALVAGLLGAGFGLARASNEVSDPCTLPSDQFVGVWDEARRAEVEAAFTATGVPFADESFEQVADGLDQKIAHWSAVRREVCHATLVEAEVPVEQMSEQLLCLDRRLRSIAGLSEALTKADAEIVARARDSVLVLEDPELCRFDEERRAVVGDDRRLALLSVEDALARARVLRELGRLEIGLEAAERAIDLASELDDPGGLARAQRERGVLLRELGRGAEAREASMAALAGAARLDDRRLESQILDDLLSTHTLLGEFVPALTIRALLDQRIDPAATPKLAIGVHLHASVLHERQQHWDEALAELDAALALTEASVAVAPDQRAQLHHNYGNVLAASGRDYERGAAEYRRAIETWTEAYGPHHPSVAKARMNLSAVYFRRGEFGEAIELLESALAELERIYPDEHPHIGVCHQNLGALRTMTGDFHEAIRHTRVSLHVTEAKLGTEHPDYATVERNLATLLVLVGEHREALGHLEHALAVYEASYEAGDSRRVSAHAELAECMWWLGDETRARSHAAAAEVGLAGLEATELRRIGPLSTLAELAFFEGDYAGAEAWARELVEFGELALGADNPDLARSRVQLAAALRALGRHAEAAEQLELARAALERGEGMHPHAWGVFAELGRLALVEGQQQQAIEHFETARALASGPEGGRVYAAVVAIELADALPASERQRAAELRVQALEVLEAYGVRPDLQTRAR